MKNRYSMVSAMMVLTVLFYGPSSGFAQVLKSADKFAVLGSSTVTNTGSSTVNGDVGVSPGSSITGFVPEGGPGTVNGTIHTADAVSLQAQKDVVTAYTDLLGLSSTGNLTGQDLGNLTLTPGVYTFNSSAQLTGPLVLNAEGLNNAVFDFQIGSTFTTASSSSVALINAGLDDGIYWEVGSSATLGTNTSLIGNILADQSITTTTGSNISCGRTIALNGAVTMDTSNISNTCDQSADAFDNGLTYGPNGEIIPMGNSAVVPEPVTIALFGLGLIGLRFKKYAPQCSQ
jgi:type VI secretion system secreted protein VgrG